MTDPSAEQLIRRDETDVVWLDLDDTLIDFRTNSRAALGLTRRHFSLESLFPSSAGWIDAYERHNSLLWKQYAEGTITQEFLRLDRFLTPLAAAGMDPDTARALSLRMDAVYLDYLAEQTAMIPGAVDFLHRLREAGFTIGILSNGFTDVQHRKIANCGLRPLIDIVVLSDDIGVNKPDPRLYNYAMSRAGICDPSRHIMIGDNPDTDIAGAIASGWRHIHFISHDATPFSSIRIAPPSPCPD